VAEVQLPQLGESVSEGIITAWLVNPGDTVTVDQPLVEISTDKVDTEIPSPITGTVTELRAQVDDTVLVGQVIAIITETDGATAPAAAAPAAATPAATPKPAPKPAPAAGRATAPSGPGRSRGTLASPLLRRLLVRAGVSPAQVSGSGHGGRVTRADVARAIAQGGRRTVDFGGARELVEPLSRVRRAIADSMLRSLQTTAQLTSVVEVDVTGIMALRSRGRAAFEAQHDVALSPLPLIARVVVDVLGRHPMLNASIDTAAGTVTFHDFVNLGIAVDTDAGLLVPNLKDAQALDVAGLATGIAQLAARSRDRSLAPDDISGGTFTITNTGSRGTMFDTPILNPPEAAILATGAVERRPVVIDDGISESVAIRSMTYLCLTYDHRLVDGADAARFLTEVKEQLESFAFADEVTDAAA
jgi:pyruvate dehydrogenase E2 component (dihydrolipoamide acetyltransferase)